MSCKMQLLGDMQRNAHIDLKLRISFENKEYFLYPALFGHQNQPQTTKYCKNPRSFCILKCTKIDEKNNLLIFNANFQMIFLRINHCLNKRKRSVHSEVTSILHGWLLRSLKISLPDSIGQVAFRFGFFR